MREMVIALGLIEQGDHFILQLREDDPMIGGAGLIGCFGGKLEAGESPLSAVCREISEETTYISSEDEFTSIGEVAVISDHNMEKVKVFGHAFALQLPDATEIAAKEGEIVRLPKAETRAHLGRMTTGTRACFEQFILGDE